MPPSLKQAISPHKYLISLLIIPLTGCGSETKVETTDINGNTGNQYINLEFENTGNQVAVVDQPYSNSLLAYPEAITVSYSSSNPDIATINSFGDITIKSSGSTQIAAIGSSSDPLTINDASYQLQVKPFYFENGTCIANNEATSINLTANTYEYDIQDSHCIGQENETLSTKEVPFNIQIKRADFIFDDNVVISQLGSSTYSYFTLGVENISDSDFCFVRITGIQLLNTDNENILSDNDLDSSFVNGNLFYSELSEIATNTCLKSNQKGLLSGIYETGPLENITTFNVTSVYSQNALNIELPALTEAGYSWTPTESSINLTFENNTSSNIKGDLSTIYFLNEDNEVIYWQFIFNTDFNTETEVGAELKLKAIASGNYNASKFIVNIDYETESSNLSFTGNSKKSGKTINIEQSYNIHEHQARLLKSRSENEAAKSNRIESSL